MSRIPESELVINDRGAVYHLDLRPDELGDIIITVGDPDRVPVVSKYFDRIEVKRQHREFVSHTGWLGTKRITVISTGIGPDNIDIALNEVDALANIDFNTREIKSQLKRLIIIRMGTCGSLQKEVPVDSFVAGSYGIGLDNLLAFYNQENNDEELDILHEFVQHMQLSEQIRPYIASPSMYLLKNFVDGYHQGITVTCPGFFGPQGRILRMGISNPFLLDHLTSFHYGNIRVCNFEMETSAIYGLGYLMGHMCLSLNVVVANRMVHEFSKDTNRAVENLICKSLSIIQSLK